MTRRLNQILPLVACMSVALRVVAHTSEPLKLDPANPHYFLFRSKPTVLIGSSEHFGAVINHNFDYLRYLDTLQAAHLNVTRIFSGQYHERPGKFGVLPTIGFNDFKIVDNTLAPRESAYIAPWQRSQQPGALDGGNKFDLSRWNPEFFQRLRGFVDQASRRGIVVEVSLFSPYYADVIGDRFWNISPLNANNNVNGIGATTAADALSLKNRPVVFVEDALVRKIVHELHRFDNIYYEICNEPEGEVSLDWQRHIARTIHAAESAYPFRHLIAQEIGYGGRKAAERLSQASVIAFHNSEGSSVSLNYDLGIPVVHNETIFDYSNAANRVSAWRFLLSGGAMWLGTDYSFTVGHEDGTFVVPSGGAGGGSTALRAQLWVLRRFMDDLPYTRMSPQPSILRSGLRQSAHASILGEPGKIYAVYLYQGRSDPLKGITVNYGSHRLLLALALPAGQYRARWIEPRTGLLMAEHSVTGSPTTVLLPSPKYSEDIVLLLSRDMP